MGAHVLKSSSFHVGTQERPGEPMGSDSFRAAHSTYATASHAQAVQIIRFKAVAAMFQLLPSGAGDGNRTRAVSLGS